MKMRRFLSALLCAALVFTPLPTTARAESDVWDGTMSQPEGEGTSASHYIIDTPEELAWFANKVNSGSDQTLYADLAADIVLNDTSNWTEWASAPPTPINQWTPIGNSQNSNRVTFDGCGHTVRGLYINSGGSYVGLFGYIGKSVDGFPSTVKNLILSESYIKGADHVGGICGYLYQSNSISGCVNNATVIGTGSYVGGIAGFIYNKASVTSCQNAGAVSGSLNVGGIAGSNHSSIIGCRNEGTIGATGDSAGGIAGYNGSSMTNVYNTAIVTGNRFVGGICGNNAGTVGNAYSTGVITGTAYTGKVCGFNAAGSSIASAWFVGVSTDKGVGINYGSATVNPASAEQFASGETAYLLGNGFGQKLGTNDFPVFRSPDGTNAVYKLAYMVDSSERAAQYYNAGDTVSTAGIPIPTIEGGYFDSWSGLPATMPGNDLTVTATFIMGESPAPAITPKSLKVGYKGVDYYDTISATGQPPITFSLSGGASLPGGLALSTLDGSTCVISGRPTEVGTTSLTIEASNEVGPPDTEDFTITINEPDPVIETSSLPTGYKGVAYGAAIMASGPGTMVYSVDSATPLPGGLSLDATTGEITGIPDEAGDFTVTFVVESEHGRDEVTLTLSVRILMVGSGTQSDPYKISTADQMFQFASIVNSDLDKHYHAELVNDIVLNDTLNWENWVTEPPTTINPWTPIGSSSTLPFSGVFDGKGNTIRGMYVKQDGDYAGLFGCAGPLGTTIRNLNLTESYIEGRKYVGGICGYLAGSATTAIENCTSAAAVHGDQYVGGITGYTITNARVRGCLNSGPVTGGRFAGGIVGENHGNISRCWNSGAVSSTTYSSQIAFGGICGHNYGTVADSYNQSDVDCPPAYNVGGVCGANTGTVTNTYSTGTVSGVSGTVGNHCGVSTGTGDLTNCYFEGTVGDIGVGTNNGSGSAMAKSAAQFASGEVAYLLGMLGSAFGQELGESTDAYPVFRSSDGSNAVYKITYMVDSSEHAAQYYNAGDTVSTAGIPIPTIEGGYFDSWLGLPAVMPESDHTVTASFNPGIYEPPTITTSSLSDGYKGMAYSAGVSATGSGTITFSLSGGTSLPAGLSLDASSGAISGTPEVVGTTSFTIVASDQWGGADTRSFTIVIYAPTPVITTSSLPIGYLGEVYSASVAATGYGTIRYALDSETPLPGGLGFDEATGAITGTPNVTGSFSVKFTASNDYGSDEVTLMLSIQVLMVGSGTESDPYRISTADQMFQFAAIVNSDTSKYYYAELANDIVLNNTENWENWAITPPPTIRPWTPIGTDPSSLFKGVFDGKGHTIRGVYVKETGEYAGLFGRIGAAGTAVKNLTLSESYVEGERYVGGICGYLAVGGTAGIENCRSEATVAGSDGVGGICGYTLTNSVVLRCQNSGSVTGGKCVGGIVGESPGNVSRCWNSGTIASTTTSTRGNAYGGICGLSNGAVADCYNTGTISSPASSSVGGICGNNMRTITSAYSLGTVTGDSNVGGICGFGGPGSDLSRCFYLGSDTGGGPGIGNSGTYKGKGTTTLKHATQFASGEVAYLLGSAFGQELGESADAHPVFRSSDGSNAVFRLRYMVDSAEHAAQYYNAGDVVSAVAIPEPTVSGGRFSHWQGLPGTMPGADVTVLSVFLAIFATVEPTEKIFAEVFENYSQQDAQQFTITNTGEGEITGLSASLSGGADSAFEFGAPLSAVSIAVGGTATVSVVPKTGLAPNTYADTLIITGDNGISLTVNLSFAVNATPSPVQLGMPAGLAWDGTVPGKAIWTAVPNASSYAIQLYRGGSAQGSSVTGITDTEYDFTSAIVSAGTGSYTFRVTAIGDGVSYTDSEPSAESPAYSYTEPVVNAAISPDSGSFDKYAPADVRTDITWGNATGVTDVEAGGVTIGAGNYMVSGDTLTIDKRYLAVQTTGSLVLTIEFDAGAPATLTITISDTTPPAINPTSRTYDLSAPADVNTAIIWNSAASVTEVVYSVRPDPTLYKLDTGDYAITGDTLIIARSFFSGLSLTAGATFDFDITFNTGDTAALTVNIENSHVPSSNADLSSLSVNGTPVSGFDPDDTEYDVELPYGSTGASVTATVYDPLASCVITDAPFLPGTATVTVTAEDGITTKTYEIRFTIAAASTVLVTNITVTGEGGISSVQVGSTLQMLADVSPANATNRNVTWSIVRGSGADISATGLLTATAAGSVTVRATASDGSDVYGEMTIVITAGPVTTYAVTFSSNGSVYATRIVNAGASIGSSTWPANPARNRYAFGGWFTGTNGSGMHFTSTTPVNAAMTVYAKWTYIGDDDDDPTRSTPGHKADVRAGDGTQTTIPVTVDRDSGTAFVDASTQDLAQGGNVTVTMPPVPGVTNYTIGMPAANLAAPNGGTLTLNTDLGSLTLPSDMLLGTAGAEGKNAQITIGQGDRSSLPDDIRAAIGERPLISLTLTLDGKQTDWNNPDAPVTVSIPYTPTPEELLNPESIVVWYIDGSGRAVSVPNGRYDPATGTVTFTTTHFSYYAVGFKQVSFRDVAKEAWYAKAVSFIAARGITTGAGDGNFSPEAKLTRGQFIVMLMKAYDIAPDTSPKDNFADAGATYYTGYLAAAKRLGISAGVGNNMFAPEKEITRQEVFTLLYNALKVIGQLPEGGSGKTLSDFSDAGDIAAWAEDAMTLLVETGAVGGSGGKLLPTSTTTRAEMAQVLYNLLGK